ncbi:MAG: vWA domain-containing protein [Promethearchaeota archaeon]
MEVRTQTGNNGKVIFHPEDISALELKGTRLIRIFEEDSFDYVVLELIIDERVPRYVILGDSNILSGIGIQDGSIVVVEPYFGPVRAAQKIIVEFSAIDANPHDFFQESSIKQLKEFLSNYFLNSVTNLYWPERYSNLWISVEEPKSIDQELYQYNASCEIELREQIQSMPFNAILLIDKSMSMTRRDVNLEGIDDTVKDLKNRLIGDNELSYDPDRGRDIYTYPKLTELFNNLKIKEIKESFVQNSNNQWATRVRRVGASRLDSVIFATLLFFQLKISRGFGEKCAFVIYANEAKIVKLGNKDFIDASAFNAQICDDLIKKIKNSNFLTYGNTNISSAIEICEQIALKYKYEEKSQNPLMILLLTDGRPYPKHLDNSERLLTTINNLKRKLGEHNIPFVLYAIGIGEAMAQAEALLKRVADEGNGAFHFAINVKELIKWYQTLANNFTYKILAR